MSQSMRPRWLKRLLKFFRSASGRRARAASYRPTLDALEARLAPANWSGTIPNGTVWATGVLQNITSSSNVPLGATLTIQPGAIVQFNNNTSLSIDGTLLAQGTASQMIIFTSVNDNSPLGGGNTASNGNWGDILFNSDSTGNMLVDTVVRYGGGGPAAEVVDMGAPLTLSSSVVSNSSSAGVRITQANPTLGSDTIQSNTGAAISMDDASAPTITTPNLSNNSINGVYLDGNAIMSSISWNNPSIVYAINGGITVNAGATLTIGAGQIIKVKPGFNGLFINGTVQANGTSSQPVIFTSLNDSSAADGGATNNNSSSTGAAGDYNGLYFNQGSSGNLNDVTVLYGGSDQAGDIVDHDAGLTLSNSTLSSSETSGLRIEGSNPTLTSDTFSNNTGPNGNSGAAVSMDDGSTPVITGAMVMNNKINGVLVDNGTITSSLSWNNADIVYVVNGNITVNTGVTLTIGAGQIVKFPLGFNGLTINGTLQANGTSGQQVSFTSLNDDTVGGPTNNNPNSFGQAGDWNGLFFNPGSTGNVLDYVTVNFGGRDQQGDIVDNQAGLTLNNGSLSNSSTAGLRIQGSNPILTGVTFENNAGAAISMDGASSPTISTPTLTKNGTNGVAVDGFVTISANNAWDNPGIVYVVTNVTVAAGVTLTIGAGQVVKFTSGAVLTVKGTVQASGTATQPVIFTSLKDDSAGGDTNNDGSATAPGAGDWFGLFFDSGSNGNLLNHVDVRYGGSDPFAQEGEVQVQGAGLTLTNSVVSNSNLGGLRIQGSNPTVTGDTFEDNFGPAISMDLASSPVISGTTLTNNTVNGVAVDGGTISASISWNNPSIVYSLAGSVTVAAGVTLSIGAGQIVKSPVSINTGLTVNGTLLATGSTFEPIVFTSVRDDSAGGDTNNDGSTTSPKAGDWNGLIFASGSSGNVLDDVEVRYGGADPFVINGEVDDQGATGLTLSNSVLSNSAVAGLSAEGSSPSVTGDTFQNNAGDAIRMDAASNPIISAVTATGNGVNAIVENGGTLPGNVSWTGQGLPYSLSGAVTVPQGDTLTIGANAVFAGQDNSNFSGPGTLANAGTFLMSSSDNGTMYVQPQFINTGTVQVRSGTLNLSGNMIVNGAGTLTGNPGGTLAVAGNLGGNTQNAAQFAPGAVTMDGSGNASTPQTLEVMSSDLGATAAGFSQNFTYYSLALSNGTYVQLVDTVHNSSGTGAEALYADNLIVPSGCTLNLNGLHAYARIAQIAGTVVNGTVTTVASAGPLVVNVISPGTLAAGATADWTFFGRAGQTVTIVANTGSSGSIVPLPPTLGNAQVTLLDPNGHIVATASNTQTGADVKLTSVALTADGTYQVQVQAPAAQSSSAGDYDLTVWDATPQTAPVSFNQTTTGTIDNPFRVDQWTFNASAGQLVQFNLVNSSASDLQFSLTGPNGTVFSGATASSGNIALPSSGAYVLSVDTVGQTGSYAFQLDSTTIANLTLGTPLSEPIAGSGQSQLFELNVAQQGQVQITLQDNASADQNELYANLGSVPTRGDAQYQFSTATSADQQLLIPTAAPGTYYILVYTAYALQPSSFTLTATEATVLLSEVTPNESGTSVATTLTLTGLGFDSAAKVSLASGGTSYPASSVSFDSPTQLTATFAAGAVPAGVYSASVSEGGATTTLANAITIVQGGQANFQASVILPNSMGFHIPATIYIEYSNIGDVAMPAPLLLFEPTQTIDGTTTAGAFLTLDASLLTQGYWTSALPAGFTHSLEFLASGATPGVLEPGESERIPVYYAGWQQPWNGSEPFDFDLAEVEPDDSTPVNWASLEQSLAPAGVNANAWNAIFANLQSQNGTTWGNFVQALDQNAAYLGQFGENVNNLSDLWSFEIAQANGLDTASLATAEDISVPVPGLPLSIDRSITSNITSHYVFGPFGYGWSLGDGWGQTLAVQSDGTVIITDSDGSQEIFQPDSRGSDYFAQPGDYNTLANLGNNVFTLTTPDGEVTEFQNGQVAYMQDADGNRITAGYTNSLLTSLTDTSGAYLDLGYNSAGLITSITNSVGQTATYTYDASNQYLLSVTDYEGFTTSYSYSNSSNLAITNALVSVTNPDGTQEDFSYDAEGRLSESSVNNGSEAVNYSYPGAGMFASTDVDGGTTTLYFDSNGQVAKTVDPLQNVTLLTYDSSGNLIQQTDSAGQVYSFAYDNQGNLIQSTDPLGDVTKYTYGPLDSLTSITDPKDNTTQYQYDQNGDLTATVYANGSIETAAYNPIGEVLKTTDADGNTTSFTYNSAGQELTATEADGSVTTYTYDAHGNLTSATDASGTITLTYNSADLLTEVAYPNGTYLKYGYDSAGRRTQMMDQAGFTVNYSYNSLGQLVGLTDGSNNPIVTYSYDAAGNLSKTLMGDGSYTLYTYDLAGNILSVVNYAAGGAVGSSFVYTYNDLGLATTETTIDGQWTYTYDAIGQLTQAVFAPNSTDPDGLTAQSLQYVYDVAGNRISETVNGVLTTYVTNNMNEYTSSTTVGMGTTTYQYDADGNLISAADASGNTTTYAYDLEGDLVGTSAPGSQSIYQYNALGQRVAATVNGQTTQYLIDPTGLGNVVAEFDGSGALTAHYTYGIGLTSQINANGQASYYTFDAVGNTAALSGSAGADHYTYLPFGASLTARGNINNPFQFGGQVGVLTDASGLQFMRLRYFDSSAGRFVQTDPSGVAGGLNLYAFTSNNPVNADDPSGLGRLPTVIVPFQGGGVPESVFEYLVELINSRAAFKVPANYGASIAEQMGARNGGKFLIKLALDAGVEIQEIAKLPGIARVLGTGSSAAWIRSMIKRIGAAKLLTSGLIKAGGELLAADPFFYYELAKLSYKAGYAVGTLINKAISGKKLDNLSDSAYRLLQYLHIVGGKPVYAHDPNASIGPIGFGAPGYIADDEQALPYTIDFENAPTATAPAQRVTVTDQLDPNLNWNTFEFIEVGFGDNNIPVPAAAGQFFQTTVSMTYNGETFNVDIQLSLNPATGLVTATFQSLDPNTALPPDALTGFLPPEDGTGRGMGYFSYLIEPKPSLPTGTQIRNVAVVTFDSNAPIATDQVDDDDPSQGTDPTKQDLNTIDAGPPTSSVTKLPATSPSTFTVSWSGADDTGGSGIASFNIYVSDNSGAFTLWQSFPATQTSASYTGQAGHSYGFYSVAIDNVGNVQPTPSAAQATTQVVISAPVATVGPVTSPSSSAVSSVTITFNEPVTGFTVSALKLTQGGGTTNLLTGAQTLTTSDNITFTLNGLASLTDPTHRVAGFTLTLTAAGSGIVDGASALATNASTTFTVVDPALSLSGTTLTVPGTSGNDTFTFTAGTPEQAVLNGVTYTIDPTVVSSVQFQGKGGTDTAILSAAGTGNTATLGFGSGSLQGTGYTASVSGVTNLYVSGGNTDSAAFTDASGSNTFVGTPGYSYLSNGVQFSKATGFKTVTAASTSHQDTALLSDASGNNHFAATPTTSTLTFGSTGASIQVSGFRSIQATAAPGTSDTATLADSFGSNLVVHTPGYSYLIAGMFAEAVGFQSVIATAGAGTSDAVYYYDTAGTGTDNFTGAPGYSYLVAGKVFTESVGFAQTVAIALAGVQDSATLYGSTGNDAFVGTPSYSYFITNGVYTAVVGFTQVLAKALGGHDSATLYDGAGVNTFIATPAYAYLSGSGYYNAVVGFTAGVTAQGSAGSTDAAYLYGSTTGGYTFIGTPASSSLGGSGFFNQVKGFGSVSGYGQGPGDMAYLYDSANGDTFAGSGSAADLYGVGYGIALDSFAQVIAYGATGATNNLSLAAIDYLFSDVGTWMPV